MSGATITVTGNVANDPTLKKAKSGISWTQFRVGSSRRWRDKEGNWVDGPTMWFTVKSWENKARNVAESLRKGTPVIVSGRLSEEPYVATRVMEGGETVSELRNGLTIENAVVGIDIARGTAQYTRNERTFAEPQGVPSWLAEKVATQNAVSSIGSDDSEIDNDDYDEELEELVSEANYALA